MELERSIFYTSRLFGLCFETKPAILSKITSVAVAKKNPSEKLSTLTQKDLQPIVSWKYLAAFWPSKTVLLFNAMNKVNIALHPLDTICTWLSPTNTLTLDHSVKGPQQFPCVHLAFPKTKLRNQ